MNLASGQKLGGRYQILSQLGQGGFGATFVAEDQHLPGKQQCVVKQLKPQATDRLTLQTARRLFDTEAQTLYRLGTHEQIPRLLAYFEENQEFYLVQEYIEGHDLAQELTPGKQFSEDEVISLLREILKILEFVHQQNVIHRDINPQNIIRRKKDGKLVLIDFGAVKQVSTQVVRGEQTSVTVAIGTPGYRPSEQANGKPKLCSDIYAVGTVGIQALTGCLPEQLPTDPQTSEISWHEQVTVSPELAKVMDKMVCYDFRQRYSSATEALQALKDLKRTTVATLALLPARRLATSLVVGKPKLSRLLLYRGMISLGVFGVGAAAVVSITNLLNYTNATNLYSRGSTLYELNRHEEALDAYKKALQIRPDYWEAWKGQGDTLQSLNRYEEALSAYDKAIQIQPNYWEAWIGRAQTLASLGRYEEAIEAFDAVIEIRPNELEAWDGRGNIQVKLEQYSEAIASFEKALKLQPNHAPAWYQRGWALHNLGRYEEAVESYDKAVEFQPDFHQAWYQRGNALVNLQQHQEAIDSYEEAVEFQPNFHPAWYSQGIALNHQGRYEDAVTAFDQAVKFKPDYYEAWYHRGWALHQANRYPEAVTSYDKAIQIKRKDPQVWYNRGNSLYSLGKYQDAIASYNQAVDLKNDYYEALYSRGNALFNIEQYAEAVASYDKALRYKPDYREARRAKAQSQRQAALTQRELDSTPNRGEEREEEE